MPDYLIKHLMDQIKIIETKNRVEQTFDPQRYMQIEALNAKIEELEEK